MKKQIPRNQKVEQNVWICLGIRPALRNQVRTFEPKVYPRKKSDNWVTYLEELVAEKLDCTVWENSDYLKQKVRRWFLHQPQTMDFSEVWGAL
jgi:hypothetical protein